MTLFSCLQKTTVFQVSSTIKFFFVSFFFTLLALTVSGESKAHEPTCPEGMSPWVTFNVYFGRGHRDNPEAVSEDEWREFLAEVITPRFPVGLTVIDTYGQYYNAEENQIFSEKTKLLNVLVPYEAIESGTLAVNQIKTAYSERYPNQGIFLTSLPVSCVSL